MLYIIFSSLGALVLVLVLALVGVSPLALVSTLVVRPLRAEEYSGTHRPDS